MPPVKTALGVHITPRFCQQTILELLDLAMPNVRYWAIGL
jgi:hypothetical protein